MSVANVAAVDAALVGLLAADAELATLLPDGVFLDVAPAGKTRFAIVQHQTHHDEDAFRMTVYEEFRYRITARVRETSGVDANAAAYRIHTLLQDVDLAGLDGYTHMATLRVERIKFPEVDAIDNDIRWQIAGGDYEITVSPGDPVPPALSYTDLVIADGAIHYWRLEAPAGNTAFDTIGDAHGTISGGVTLNQPGALADGNPAMTFDGTTGKVSMAGVTIPVIATVELWFKTTGTSYHALLSTRQASTGSTLTLFIHSGLEAYGLNPSASYAVQLNLSDGTWHHLAFVMDGTEATPYFDGLVSTFAAQPFARLSPSVGGCVLGQDTDSGGYYFPGTLDEIAIYPLALTPQQIAAHYTAATTARRSPRTRTRKD